jgi:hypothetical protein
MIHENWVISAAPAAIISAAHHQRAEDAPEQHAVLVERGHRQER